MFDLPPGLSAFLADARQFLVGVHFQRPAFWALALLPVLLAKIARLTNRILAIGSPTPNLGRPITVSPSRLRTAKVTWLLGWVLLAGAMAGPTWGTGDREGVSIGRDVVVVLDFSRSMLADDSTDGKARWQNAQVSTLDLVSALKTRGHRVGVVVFAARPMMVVPLTSDPAFAAEKLATLDARYLPAEIRPADDQAPSGTRIGAAIMLAIATHDTRFSGVQDIVLLSDGDDPAKDAEWKLGVNAARGAKVPVHTIGFGDPDRDSPIMVNGDLLKVEQQPGNEEIAQTRLHEEVLKAIAEESRGSYLRAGRSATNLSEFFRTTIEPLGSRELTDDQVPQPVPRAHWFLLVSVSCFVASLWFRLRLSP